MNWSFTNYHFAEVMEKINICLYEQLLYFRIDLLSRLFSFYLERKKNTIFY